jgi:hypothetical protein
MQPCPPSVLHVGAGAIGRVGAVLALVTLLAACGDDAGSAKGPDSGSSTSPSSSSSTSVPRAVTSSTGPLSIVTIPIGAASAGATLPDGTVFGYITTLQVNDTTVTGEFDLAELLTGDAAVAAAQADGQVADNDYYIRNNSKKLRAITVDPDAAVLDIDYQNDCCEPKPTDIATFVADRDAAHETRTAVYLTTTDGAVTRVAEQFFP